MSRRPASARKPDAKRRPATARAQPTDAAGLEARARRLHERLLIFDGLATSFLDPDYLGILRHVGIDAVHYTVASTRLVHGRIVQDDFVSACRNIGYWYRILEECRAGAGLATRVADIEALRARGRVAVFLGFQNGSPIEDNLDYLHLFHRLGVRFIMLTYNTRNFIGSGGGERVDSGLSDFGRAAIREMNRLGIAIDLSHCGDRTSRETIDCSERPVLFTHANAKALAPTPRNKPDGLIRRLAARGGVIGPKHMLGNTRRKRAEQTTVEDYVDQIDYLVNLVGIEHVALGTDFSGTVRALAAANAHIEAIRAMNPNAYIGKRAKPRGFDRIDGLFRVTAGLLRRGYREMDIARIYSKNLCRVLRVIFHEKGVRL